MSDEYESEWERRKQFIRNGFPMPHCGGKRYTMPDDIAEELKVRAAIEQVEGTVFERAAVEIERLRSERDELQKWKDAHNTFWRDRAERRDAMRESGDGIDWKHRALCAEASLGTYKRAYARQCCKDLYSSGARWKTRPNPMRDDGVFIEEACDPGKNRTHFPFPYQFEHDVANEIVELLNRATDDLEREER